jgi:hypothetical protein
MYETPIDAMRKRDELKAKRRLLFQRFLKNPLETHLALEIKIIDDQVAECSELVERKNHMTIPRFDIFRIDKDGGLFWIGTADDVVEARELATQNPSRSKDFILFDLKTGAKTALKAGGSDGQG